MEFTYVDTVGMARFLLPALEPFQAGYCGKGSWTCLWIITTERWMMQSVRHDIFEKFVEMLQGTEDIFDVDQLNEQRKGFYRHHQKAAHLPCHHLCAVMKQAGSICTSW